MNLVQAIEMARFIAGSTGVVPLKFIPGMSEPVLVEQARGQTVICGEEWFAELRRNREKDVSNPESE